MIAEGKDLPSLTMFEAEEEFKKYHNRLRQELDEADWNFQIAKYISDMTNEYRRELNQAPAFWNLTIKAHLFTSLIHLNNLFGKKEKEKFLHMDNFLDFVRNNLSIFEHKHFKRRLKVAGRYNELAAGFISIVNAEKVKQDTEKLGKLPISSLKAWRNKVLSHIDRDFVKAGTNIPAKHPIKTKHVQEIIDALDKMLNEYELAFDFSTWSRRLPIGDDIKNILDAIKYKLEANKASRLKR
ncbi:MAG: hypothetical protein HY662_03615 [Chloroflexi bacterium]|nr:hypothetical protein [Chloroflexota bacterium]